jgi:parallel beta-helix repeat protein
MIVFQTKTAKTTNWTLGTITIRSDGSLDPPEAPIERTGSTYTLMDDIITDAQDYGIKIERSSVVVDGAGHKLQGVWQGVGIAIESRGYVTIKNMEISEFQIGIAIGSSSNVKVQANNITSNGLEGISIDRSANSIISGNRISNHIQSQGYGSGISSFSSDGNNVYENILMGNENGVWIQGGKNNKFYHNDFISNTEQVFTSPPDSNIWDNGYPDGGNFWSNYFSIYGEIDQHHGPYQNETGSDGIWDHPYIFSTVDRDNYPLVKAWGDVSSPVAHAGLDQTVEVGESIAFDGSKSTDDLGIRNCEWTFIDTTPKMLTGVHPTYAFGSVGNFEVTLNISDYADNWDTDTMWVHVLPDTTPPTITILSPQNLAYASNAVALTFRITEPTSWIAYSLSGQSNTTITGNTTMLGLSEGAYTITIYANDTAGNMGASPTIHFTVDLRPPNIEILLPENKTDTSTSVTLSFTLDEATSWIGYSLDGKTNQTIPAENVTISGLSEGSHSLVVYAKDIAGNAATSRTIYFTVQTRPPLEQWILVMMAVIGIAGAIALLYFLKKRREKKDLGSDRR